MLIENVEQMEHRLVKLPHVERSAQDWEELTMAMCFNRSKVQKARLQWIDAIADMDSEYIVEIQKEHAKAMDDGQVMRLHIQKLVITIQLTSKSIFTNVGLYIF